MTALLGHSEWGQPIVLNLLADQMANVLIAGDIRAGKTRLLQTLILSLAIGNKQAQFQCLVIDGMGYGIGQRRDTGSLLPLNYIPHMLCPVIFSSEDTVQAFENLIQEIHYRKRQAIKTPTMLIAVDNLEVVLEKGHKAILGLLHQLLQDGPVTGLQLVLATGNPTTPQIRSLLRCNLPIRLVGRVADEVVARAATGIPDSQAEYLTGRGDFLAIIDRRAFRFQSTLISDGEMYQIVQHLHRQNKQEIMI